MLQTTKKIYGSLMAIEIKFSLPIFGRLHEDSTGTLKIGEPIQARVSMKDRVCYFSRSHVASSDFTSNSREQKICFCGSQIKIPFERFQSVSEKSK